MGYLKPALGAGSALLLIALLWPAKDEPDAPATTSNHSTHAAHADSAVTTTGPQQHQAQVSTQAELQSESEHEHGHDHGQPMDEDTVDRSHWFETAALTNDERFAESETSFTTEGRCDQLNTAMSLEHNLNQLTAIDHRQRYPEALLYHALTQFWQNGDHYYQFVALWERDQPATYRYEFYRAQDPQMSTGLTAMELPLAVPKVRSVTTTNDYVRALIQQAQQEGASIGARIIEASPIIDRQQQHLTLVNSRVSQWQGPDFSCSSSNQTALCSCNQG